MHDMNHLQYLDAVARADVAHVERREATYMGSWKRSGGRSAWYMLRRKIDRLLQFMARPELPDDWSHADLASLLDEGSDEVTLGTHLVRYMRDSLNAEDVFAKVEEQDGSGADGTVLAEMRDLRQYLLLVEAELVARGAVTELASGEPVVPLHFVRMSNPGPGTPEDGGHHARQSAALHDGAEPDDLVDGATYITVSDPHTGNGYLLVDRRRHDPEDCEMLQELAVEQNYVEWVGLPAWYRGLYEKDSSDGKYKLKPEYVERWGRQA